MKSGLDSSMCEWVEGLITFFFRFSSSSRYSRALRRCSAAWAEGERCLILSSSNDVKSGNVHTEISSSSSSSDRFHRMLPGPFMLIFQSTHVVRCGDLLSVIWKYIYLMSHLSRCRLKNVFILLCVGRRTLKVSSTSTDCTQQFLIFHLTVQFALDASHV